MAGNLITDIANHTDIGSRDRPEDRISTVVSPDGSWVLAATDGLGGQPFGDETAQAAFDVLPARIERTADPAGSMVSEG